MKTIVLSLGVLCSLGLATSSASAARSIDLPFVEEFVPGDYDDLLWVADGTHVNEPQGGWNGSGAARFTPPPNGGYCGLGSFHFSNGQPSNLNIRMLFYYSADYAVAETRNNKVFLVVPSTGTRPMIFHHDYNSAWLSFAPCDGTVCKYANPDPENEYWPSEHDTFRVGGGNYEEQWVSLEMEIISASEEINLYITTHDGAFSGLYRTKLGQFSGPMSYVDILGGYFNDDYRAIGSGEYYKISHLAIDDEYIGPPDGFLGGSAGAGGSAGGSGAAGGGAAGTGGSSAGAAGGSSAGAAGGSSAGAAGGSGTGAAGGSGTGGFEDAGNAGIGDGAPNRSDPIPGDDESGCGCRTSRGHQSGLGALFSLAAALLWILRRRSVQIQP